MRKGFTMLELVFVIVVIGILAASIIPNTRSHPVREAATDLVSKIRYTQHLAMVDDKANINSNWYKNRWQVKFQGNTYSILSKDKNNNLVYATDPLKRSTTISNIDLNDKYSVSITVSGTECGVAGSGGEYVIAFDHLGRPIAGDLNNLISSYSGTNVQLVKSNDCNIILTNGSESATINIQPETGYTHIN